MKASIAGITSLVVYSSKVLEARGGNVFIKADPSTMIAEASGLVSAVAMSQELKQAESTALKGTHNYIFICCHCSWCCAVWHP